MMKTLSLVLALVLAPITALAQGLPLGTLRCTGTFAGIPMVGVVDFTLYQYGQFSGVGGTGIRSQISYYIREGRMEELPGTAVMFAYFESPRGFANFEAQVVGGVGRGAVWLNGASHRQTFADFGFLPGQIVMVTEDGARVTFDCEG